jgi:hypothetical protein
MAQQMQQVPIGTIHPYGNNPRDNTKSVDKVAESMNYSYDHIRRLHGEALTEFEEANKAEVERWQKQQR